MQRDPFETAFAGCPLVAILRGLRAEEAVEMGEAIVAAGFTILEVPLNSPDALVSIARLASALGDRAVVGAGTVLTCDEVSAVGDAGGRLIVSPNTKLEVIAASVAAGLYSLPGFATPSEAFAALEAGATALKLFPAEGTKPQFVKALRAVLPADVKILPVGGIAPDTMAAWLAAGASGFGLGSALYRPGMTPQMLHANGRDFIKALAEARTPLSD